jgi:hypothetical protein
MIKNFISSSLQSKVLDVTALKKWEDIKEIVDEGLVPMAQIDSIIKEVAGRKKVEGPLTLSEFKVRFLLTTLEYI